MIVRMWLKDFFIVTGSLKDCVACCVLEINVDKFVFQEGLWCPEEPTVVVTNYCEWPLVSCSLGLLLSCHVRARSDSYARECNLFFCS